MKKIIILASVLFSSALFAARTPVNVEWSDLELYKEYKLTQDIAFDEGVTFKAGEKFTMYDFVVGDVPVLYYEMHSSTCTDPELTTDMILVDVNGRGYDNTVIGVQLGKGCNLEIYTEASDYYKISAFAE
ncbi:MAG: hypothetical protein K2Q18_12700 [Bdellovibrionales bacterium]|nr:hypothetical protein [Bdellovibrionales bacterium]